jgi:hypothetical protein
MGTLRSNVREIVATGPETPTGAGTPFCIQKAFVSSTILHGSDLAAFTASGGDLLIESVTFETDATGLAAGTNLDLKTDTVRGVTGIICAETVANLGANHRVEGSAASVTAFPAHLTLESGKHLNLRSTVADCTGAGKLYVTVRGYRTVAGATII